MELGEGKRRRREEDGGGRKMEGAGKRQGSGEKAVMGTGERREPGPQQGLVGSACFIVPLPPNPPHSHSLPHPLSKCGLHAQGLL